MVLANLRVNEYFFIEKTSIFVVSDPKNSYRPNLRGLEKMYIGVSKTTHLFELTVINIKCAILNGQISLEMKIEKKIKIQITRNKSYKIWLFKINTFHATGQKLRMS